MSQMKVSMPAVGKRQVCAAVICFGLGLVLLAVLLQLNGGAVMSDKPSHLDRMRKILLAGEEAETYSLTGGDQVPDEFWGLFDWWMMNREWLLPSQAPRKYIAKAVPSGGSSITVTEHYNNTGYEFSWAYTATGCYTATPDRNLPSKTSVLLTHVGENGEYCQAGAVGVSSIVIYAYNSSGTLADGEFYIEINVFD